MEFTKSICFVPGMFRSQSLGPHLPFHRCTHRLSNTEETPRSQSRPLKYTIEGSSTNLGGLAAPPLYPGHCSTLVEDIARLMAEPILPGTSVNVV
jgi:hypothetical protein